ncbi:hypothetical protein ACEWY4_004369 [Coilia grayii]|uniref:Transcription factor IIIB 50 kDa subunit n=1 Tax=Coilia grayii TaxID=363190 RepID=A0ABD1KLC4_9TELE
MPHTCAECGSTNVVQDDLYSEATLVCEDCGSVISVQHLTTTRSEEVQGTAVPYYASTEVTKQPCRNLIKGIKRVHALCRIFRFPGDMESCSVELYKQACAHPAFLMVRMEKKEVLAGACMVAVARMNNWPVAMGTIGSLLEADATLLGAVYQDLVKSLQLQANSSAITDLLESFCHGLNLTAQAVGEEFSESPDRLIERGTALVELAGDTWLVTGRHPLRICLAVAYLAWQSFRPVSRLKVSLVQFCRLTKVKVDERGHCSPAAQARVKELKDVLCKLGAQLPWLRGAPVDPRRVATLVEDIVKYRRVLLAMTLRSHEEALEADDTNKNTTTGTVDGTSSVTSVPAKNNLEPSRNIPRTSNTTPTVPRSFPAQPEHTQVAGDGGVPTENTFKHSNIPALSSSTHMDLPVSDRVVPDIDQRQARAEDTKPGGLKRKAGEMICTTTTTTTTRPEEMDALRAHGLEEEERSPPAGQESQCTLLPSDHWGKRQLFLPPCINQKRKRLRTGRGPDVTGDEEISDSEIESYIRTPEEVQDIVKTQRSIAEEQKFKDQQKAEEKKN